VIGQQNRTGFPKYCQIWLKCWYPALSKRHDLPQAAIALPGRDS
jgi:hypothetical protein